MLSLKNILGPNEISSKKILGPKSFLGVSESLSVEVFNFLNLRKVCGVVGGVVGECYEISSV